MKRTLISACIVLLLAVTITHAQPMQGNHLLNKKFSRYLHPTSRQGWIEFRDDSHFIYIVPQSDQIRFFHKELMRSVGSIIPEFNPAGPACWMQEPAEFFV